MSDRLGDWRARVARFEAQSVDLARLPDNDEVQDAANLAAWQAAGALRDAASEVAPKCWLAAELHTDPPSRSPQD